MSNAKHRMQVHCTGCRSIAHRAKEHRGVACRADACTAHSAMACIKPFSNIQDAAKGCKGLHMQMLVTDRQCLESGDLIVSNAMPPCGMQTRQYRLTLQTSSCELPRCQHMCKVSPCQRTNVRLVMLIDKNELPSYQSCNTWKRHAAVGDKGCWPRRALRCSSYSNPKGMRQGHWGLAVSHLMDCQHESMLCLLSCDLLGEGTHTNPHWPTRWGPHHCLHLI